LPPRPTAVDVERLEEALAGLGLTSTERRTYRFLLESGPSTPTQVASATRQSRGRIYETLRLLVERGLAREEPSRPIRYYAASPAEAVRVALAHAERQSALLRRAYGSLARAAQAPPNAGPRTKPTDVVVLRGRRQVFDELLRLADEARQVIHLEGGGRFADRVAAHPALVKALQGATRRQVRTTVHLPPASSAAGRARLERLLGPGVVTAIGADLSTDLNFGANESAALHVHPEPDDASAEDGRDVGFRVTGASFVTDLLQRYERPILAEDGAGLAAQDGQDPAAAFLDALDGARTEILAFDTALFRSGDAEEARAIRNRLDRAKQRRVDCRLLVAADAPAPERTQTWQTRLVPWTPTPLVIIDRRVVFQLVLDQEDEPILRATRQPHEVRFYLDLFERLWQQASQTE